MPTDNRYLDPAATVIAKCGGIRKVSRLLGIAESTVLRWRWSEDLGGRGGLVPQRYWAELLNYADRHRLALVETDFHQRRDKN